ncbi:hypothetical protein BH10BAC2_BH10BAC2_22060 [soil metagenome]
MLSSNRAIDESADRKAILALQQQERTAHFNKDANLFVSEFAPDLYTVNKGKVDSSSVAEHRKKIQSYFDIVKFIKWEDVAEPIIQFSDDHSMAYAIIQKQVILERKDSTGKIVNDTTDFAWTSFCRKLNNEWKLECNTSTNK